MDVTEELMGDSKIVDEDAMNSIEGNVTKSNDEDSTVNVAEDLTKSTNQDTFVVDDTDGTKTYDVKMIVDEVKGDTPNNRPVSRKEKRWLMKILYKVSNSKAKAMRKHGCKFDNTKDAIKHNGKWLKHYKWDLTYAIKQQAGTMLEPGSESRKSGLLEQLWGKYEYWSKMKKIINEGLSYPLVDLPEESRKQDLDYMIKRGNHKSTTATKLNYETLKTNYAKEVVSGWMLPLPVDCLQKVKGAAVIPVGIVT